MDENEVAKLRTYDGPDRVVLSSDYWEMIKNDKPPLRFVSGMPTLDKYIDGFESGEVIVVSGPSGHGKTTFCQTVMLELASRGKRSLFFSYENDPKRIAEQHRENQKAIYMPLDHRPMNLHWLEKRCLEAALKFPDLSAIFIDHLHYVVDMASRQNMSLEIGQTMRFVKQNLAIGLGLPVFMVAHMTKVPQNEEPNMGHLRDSAMVGCEADTVLVIWRQFSEMRLGPPTQAILKVEKARRVGTMGRKIPMLKEGLILMENKDAPVSSW